MIIGIDMGHPLTGGGTGAVGIRKETDCNREIGKKVISKLQTLGHTLVNCTTDYAKDQNQSLSDRVKLANAQYLDLLISIHLNCGGGHGSEVLTYGGKEFKEAKDILNNICALGYRNRGIKDGSGLYVIRNTKAKSILIECCFIDSQEDMNRYNAEDIANAIVKGITGQETKDYVDSNKSNKVKYCLEFQKFYNKTTQTKAPILEDGLYGDQTKKAYEIIGELIKQ